MTEKRKKVVSSTRTLLTPRDMSRKPTSSSQICNICGGSEFLPGPGGRLSATGENPRCASCQNLERHRTLRRVYDKLREALPITNFSCLQISEDRCIEPTWFGSHLTSIYDGSHSLDIQKLPLASRIFDCVICNHVLEHVPNDTAAIGELARVTSHRGFLQIGVPDPIRMQKTDDWGYPRWEDHGHIRKYGIDIVEKLKANLEGAALIRVVESDPVTNMPDIFFFITQSPAVEAALKACYPAATIDGKASDKVSLTTSNHPTLHPAQYLRDYKRFREYAVASKHQGIEGWVLSGALSAIATFDGLQRHLGIKGHVCEIGVHHGRLFLFLSLLRQFGEKSLAIDVFDLQELNVDQSGKGDRRVFEENVTRWLAPDSDVIIKQADSLELSSSDITELLKGKVRLFSVDGSHTCEHTLNDIRLAEGALAPGGIVIVDDFLNPDWPGVVEAVTQYLNEDSSQQLEPIGYGQNKFYFTTKGYAQNYRDYARFWLRYYPRTWKDVVLSKRALAHFSFPPIERMFAQTSLNSTLPVTANVKTVPPITILGAPTVAEKDGTWMLGEWSGIALELSTAPRVRDDTVELTISGMVFAPSDKSVPEISVYVFQNRIGHLKGEKNGHANITIDIDMRLAGPSGRVEIWLRNTNAISPAELGLSADARRLSFFLRTIAIRNKETAQIQ